MYKSWPSKMLSGNVTRWGWFFNIVLFAIHTFFSISAVTFGSHWRGRFQPVGQKSHWQEIWCHQDCNTGSQPRDFSCWGKDDSWGQIRRLERLLNQFKSQSWTAAFDTKISCAGTLSWWNKTPFISFPGQLVLIAFHNHLNKLVLVLSIDDVALLKITNK